MIPRLKLGEVYAMVVHESSDPLSHYEYVFSRRWSYLEKIMSYYPVADYPESEFHVSVVHYTDTDGVVTADDKLFWS
jgi:hypothetical protein